MNTERSMMHRTMESYDPMVIGCSPSQQQDMVVQSCYHAAVWSFTTKAVPEEIWIQAASENVLLLLVRGKLSEIMLCFADIFHVHHFGQIGTDFKVTQKKDPPGPETKTVKRGSCFIKPDHSSGQHCMKVFCCMYWPVWHVLLWIRSLIMSIEQWEHMGTQDTSRCF